MFLNAEFSSFHTPPQLHYSPFKIENRTSSLVSFKPKEQKHLGNVLVVKKAYL